MRRLAWLGVALPLALLGACSGSGPEHHKHAVVSLCPPPARAAVPLSRVRTGAVTVPGSPYSVVTSRTGQWAFASLPHAVAVLSTRAFVPRLVRLIRLPAGAAGGVHGLALTAGGTYLLAAAGSGAVVIDVARAERGRHAVLGMLRSPVSARLHGPAGASAVLGSRDGRYVFVARARAGGVAVFDLSVALARRLRSSGLLGVVPVGLGPVSMALAPSGRRLYVTNVATAPGPDAKPVTTTAGTAGSGSLAVIDASLAERRPWRSVVRTLPAGCEPVAVTTSSNGKLVWVATLSDHSVLAFSASRIVRQPRRSLMAVVRVGQAPIGLLSYAGGRRLLVADSGRAAGAGPAPRLTVIDTARALAGTPAVLGAVTAGPDPRQFALVARRPIALLSDYGSAEIEALDLATIR